MLTLPRTVWRTAGIDATGDTPLLAACRMAMDEDAEHEPVRLLLEQRANPDLAPAGVQAPLLLSCAKGKTPVLTPRPIWSVCQSGPTADWPRLAGVWGSLRHDVVLKEASGGLAA